MTRLLSILLVIMAACSLTASAATDSDDNQPKVELAERTYDFGTVHQSDKAVTHTFTVTNTGQAPLVIINATASCGCTRPTYTDRPILPGESGQIKVTFMPAGQRGQINKEVKVKTNAPSSKRFTLRITGTVIP